MSDALSRARQRLAGANPVPSISGPQPDALRSTTALIQFPMGCSVTLRQFAVVGEPRGDMVRMLSNESPNSSPSFLSGRASAPPLLTSLGNFSSFDRGTWPGCPYCHTVNDVAHGVALLWVCTACQSQGRA